MSLMSAAEGSRADSAGIEFLVPVQIPVPASGAAGSGPGSPVRLITVAGGQAQSPPVPDGHGGQISELYVRELEVRHVRSGGYRVRRQPARPTRSPRSAPLRLTRRGRLVVTVFALLTACAAAAALWLSAAGGAQASSHGQPAKAGYQGMTRVVVDPGQTLWSIAAAAEPTANIQTVVQQIINANALGGTTIHPGQTLWVPRA